ncbi:hypothetical protein Tco_0199687 [Tanacetum coccineum]
MREEASCDRTSGIYQEEEDQSFSIRLTKVDIFIKSGEQFVTEEIIEEGNRWPNIEVRTTLDRKIIRAASLNRGTIAEHED